MLNSFTTKFRSLLFPQQTSNSRKRKRSLEDSDDQDCEIIDVKRPKQESQQLGYNFFAKMAEWVKNKTSWDKMFDFKPKEGSRNGQLQQGSSEQGIFNGNGLPDQGQNQINYNKGHRRREISSQSYNRGSTKTGSNGGHLVNGDSREIPPDDIISKGHQVPGRRTYASVVKNSSEQRGDNQQKAKVTHSTQTNTDPSEGHSRQKSLFSKRPDIQFTAMETVRLDEKERYKMLLQQYTTVPLKPSHRDTPQDRSSQDRSTFHRPDETLLGSRVNNYITKIDISHTREIPRHTVTPKYVTLPTGSFLSQRHISPLDLIKSASLSCSTVQSPTSHPERPLLESTRVVESHHDKSVFPEKDFTLDTSKRNIDVSHTDYRSSKYLSENWASDLMSKYSSSARERNRKIAEAEIRAKIYEERRKGRDDDIEKRLRQQMRLYEKEPAVTEDLPIEIEEEEDEKEEILPEITAEMDDIINKALRGQPGGEVLVEGYRLQITRGDISTLGGLNWLNDEVINFYMNMLMERGEKETYPKCYAFNTFFYPKIMSGGHSTVRRWTKKVDIFSYNYIIIPVHLGMHWCLCIVDFKKKSIRYYDSMGGQNTKCLNAVKQYLCDECKDKKNQQFDVSGWTTEIVEDIPQQMNGSDCGMFACKFAEYITREAKITFEQKHMSYFRRRMVYEIVKKQLLQ